MAKQFDINEYVASLNLSEEDKKTIAPILAKPEVVAEIQRGWNSKAEGSALMNEVSAARTAAAAEKAEADRLRAEAVAETEKNRTWAQALGQYKDQVQTELAPIIQERDSLRAGNKAYEAYLAEMGIEAPTAIKTPPPPVVPPAREQPPVNQPAAFATITPEEMKRLGLVTAQQMQPAINVLGDIPFELTALNFRHMELYGKPIPAAELNTLKTDYLNPQNTRSLTDIAGEKFHFGDREKQLEDERIARLVEERSQELYSKRMSELNLPSAALDSLTPSSVESAVKFASKGFSENASRATDGDSTQVSQEEMQAFLQIDQELAAQGIRPSNY